MITVEQVESFLAGEECPPELQLPLPWQQLMPRVREVALLDAEGRVLMTAEVPANVTIESAGVVTMTVEATFRMS